MDHRHLSTRNDHFGRPHRDHAHSTKALRVAALLSLVALAACSYGNSGAPGAATPNVGSPAAGSTADTPVTSAKPGGGKYGNGNGAESAAPTGASSGAPMSGVGSIVLADTTLGKVVADGASGMTLYAFTPDEGGTPSCYDACATTWPPATSTGTPGVGAGLDAALLKSVARTDGTTQLIYGGWPLYFFAGDKNAGDTSGQGLNGKWYVVSADGGLIGR